MCRIKEHRRATRNGDINASAVAEHVWKNGHKVNWDAAEVLDVRQEWYKRCLLESWYIKLEGEPLNRDQGVLPQIYTIIITVKNITTFHSHINLFTQAFLIIFNLYCHHPLIHHYISCNITVILSFPDEGTCRSAETSETK